MPSTITSGGSATLDWSHTNVKSCTANFSLPSVNNSGSTGGSGVGPTKTTTYTLTCTGPGGTASANTTVTVNPVAAPTPSQPSVSVPTISSVNPSPAQVGQSLTVYFSNGGQTGSVILKTLDGTKTWAVPYTTGTVYNGFVYYDGSKVTFTVPSTIGRGLLPENSGYEAPIPITSGTYNMTVYATGCPAVSGTCLGNSAISIVFPITINAPSSATVTPNPTTTPSTQPSVTVLSPTGGQVFSPGQLVTIQWQAKNLSTVDISLDVGTYAQGIASGISASLGSYSWTVPSLEYGTAKYTIAVSGAGTGEVGASGNSGLISFTTAIPSPTPSTQPTSPIPLQPSVTITAPSGVTCTIGQPCPINWTSTGVNQVSINVNEPGSGVNIASNVSASLGTYSWTVPSTFTPGTSYNIQVVADGKAVFNGNTFSIVAPVLSSASVAQPSITVTPTPTPAPLTQSSVPTISSITQTSVAPSPTFIVSGSNFNSRSFISLEGQYGFTLIPTILSSTSLSFTIPGITSSFSKLSDTVQVGERTASGSVAGAPLSNPLKLTTIK
jgi:hypothetical protein